VSGTEWLLAIPPYFFGLALHELAHAWVADRLGDPTARWRGRLTLNPLPHISMLGTLLLPALQLLCVGHVFLLWLTPIPIDPQRLRRPHTMAGMVAAAGPLANLAQAIAWITVTWLLVDVPDSGACEALRSMASWGVFIN